MVEARQRAITWHVAGESVCGAAHVRLGFPNQDAILWQSDAGEGSPLILSISDGHGSGRSFRSHVGSCLAVETALQQSPALLSEMNLSSCKRLSMEWLPQSLVKRWRERVQSHIQQHPFSDEEQQILAGETNIWLAYGATLLTVMITESFIVYLQLGDGDILVVSDDGEVFRPIPADERLFAEQTTSLCSPGAWQDFRVYFQVLSGLPPALILLSTDGYANSFRDEAGFLQVGSDLLAILREEGIAAIKSNLRHWLVEASEIGSGDDITLGLICRKEIWDE